MNRKKELTELAENQARLPAVEKAREDATISRNSAKDQLFAAQQKQQQEMLLIKAVRELDIKIDQKETSRLSLYCKQSRNQNRHSMRLKAALRI